MSCKCQACGVTLLLQVTMATHIVSDYGDDVSRECKASISDGCSGCDTHILVPVLAIR